MRVLIIEDSPVASAMLKEMLSFRGHQIVAEAKDQAQAVAAYQAHKPDFITLDLGLGKDSGLNVLKALLAIDGKAKVLVITGNPQANIREQVLAAGALGFVTKPLNVNELEAAMARASVR